MSIGASRQAVHSIYRFNSRCQELTNSFTIRLIFHMQLLVNHFNYHIFKSICTFVISFQGYTNSIKSFQIYLVYYQNTLNKDRVSEQTKGLRRGEGALCCGEGPIMIFFPLRDFSSKILQKLKLKHGIHSQRHPNTILNQP